MRYIFQESVQDGFGNAISGASITVYLAGTSTKATIYTAVSGGSADADSVITSDSAGYFKFFVDEDDYPHSQRFKITVTYSGYTADSWGDYLQIFPDSKRTLITDSTADQGDSGTVGTLAWHISDLAGEKSDISILPGTYKITTNVTVPATVNLRFEQGALVKPDSAKTLTATSPEIIIAEPRQQIIDMTNNSTNPLLFTYGGVVHVEWWGSGTTALSVAVAALTGGGTILISDDITESVGCTVPAATPTREGLKICGTKPWVKITMSHASNPLFDFDPSGDFRLLRFELENLILYGPGATSGNAINVEGDGFHVNLIVRNIRIEQFQSGKGIYAKEVYNSSFENVFISECDYGIYLDTNANTNSLRNVAVMDCHTAGAYFGNLAGVSWFGGWVEDNWGHGLWINGVEGGNFNQVYFETNNADAGSYYSLYIQGSSGLYSNYLTFVNCLFKGAEVATDGVYMTGVSDGSVDKVSFINCRSRVLDGAMVTITSYVNDTSFINSFDRAKITDVSANRTHYVPDYFGPHEVAAAATGGADTFTATVEFAGTESAYLIDFLITGYYNSWTEVASYKITAGGAISTNTVIDADSSATNLGDGAKKGNLTLSGTTALGSANKLVFTFTNADTSPFSGSMKIFTHSWNQKIISVTIANNQ